MRACGQLRHLRELRFIIHRCHPSHIRDILRGSFGQTDQLDIVVHDLDRYIDLVPEVLVPSAWRDMPPSVRRGGMARQTALSPGGA